MSYSPVPAMVSPEMVRPHNPGKLLDYCMAKFNHSADNVRDYQNNTLEIYNLNRCIYTGGKLPYKNKVMLPLLYSAYWSAVADKIQTSLGEYPYVECEANAPEERASARRITALTNAQAERINIVSKMTDFLGSGEVYGTGIGRYHWSHVVQRHKFRQNVMGREMVKSQDVVKKNTWDFNVVDILNFFPCPGYKFIEDMPHCHQAWLDDFDNLLAMNYSAVSQGQPPIYYPEALQQLAKQGFNGGGAPNIVERQSAQRNYTEWQLRRSEEYAKPVEIIEHWGFVPSGLASDEYMYRVVTIANGTIILRDECNPYWHTEKPFFSYAPMPDLHNFYGVGKAEIGARMARAANKLVSMRIDTMEMFGSPSFIVKDSINLGGQTLALWPGRVIKAQGVGPENIQPIAPDLRGTQLVFDEVNALSRYLGQAHGRHEDTLQGIDTGNRTTAREFMGRTAQGRTRTALEARLFEIQALEPLFEAGHKLNRQFLPSGQWVKIIGAAALTDINTGMPIPPEPEILTLDDLNTDFRFRAKGATQFLSREMQGQNMLQYLQLLPALQPLMALTNFQAVSNKMWTLLGQDPTEMTNVQIPAINMMAQEANPNMLDMVRGLMGGGNTQLPQLNAGQLGGQSPYPIPSLGGNQGG